MLGFHPIAAAPVAALVTQVIVAAQTGPTPAGARWSYRDAERYWNKTNARQEVREYAKELVEIGRASCRERVSSPV
mgnify:CR=1 FL=1